MLELYNDIIILNYLKQYKIMEENEFKSDMDELSNLMLEQEKEMKLAKEQAIQDVTGLINLDILYFFKNDLSYWEPQGIVDLIKYDKFGKPFATESNATLEYEYQEESEVKDIDHIYIWQNNGYSGDDYSGWMLYPLSNGKYWKIYYNC